MKLTDEQLLEVTKKLQVHECPYCKSKEMKRLTPIETQLLSFERSNGSIDTDGEANVIPVIVAECPDCAYVMMFKLTTLGVVIK